MLETAKDSRHSWGGLQIVLVPVRRYAIAQIAFSRILATMGHLTGIVAINFLGLLAVLPMALILSHVACWTL
ncbi:hypothetical protein AT959_18800 [Dechloromonas denitrificans]|uniref:Uncharacterized protein n=1 Tax=Dechloromonas denitrificans TaxID=281362 RepID=A0A133XE68_9RHOO|nr:hypothetical protein AT959_18800 [Dechloromonas denitrificans]